MTNKQIAFRDYLIQRLGFENKEFINSYTNILTETSKYFKYFRAFPISDLKNKSKEVSNILDYYSLDDSEENYVPSKYTIVDYLIDEYQLKKNNSATWIIFEVDKYNILTATDLSTFSFCPASYSISKSIVVEKTVSAKIGTQLHEAKKLIKITQIKNNEDNDGEYFNSETRTHIDNENKALFDDIENSKLLYSGHDEKEKKYFSNKKGNFIGQPDYIFEKSNGSKFIVEEKFKERKGDNQFFFNNHIVQLASYIYGLDKFEAKYGYLVYWYYSYNYGRLEVNSCKIMKLVKSDKVKHYLNEIFTDINNFKFSKEQDFDIEKLNPIKCANCAVNRYCGHKTGRFNKLKFPYSSEYFKTWYAPYPDILKKAEDKPDEN